MTVGEVNVTKGMYQFRSFYFIFRPEDYIPSASSTSVYMPPDCTIYTDLPYSVHAFEHLEGMKDREKLTGTPELGLKNAITYQDTVDEYGHRIYEAFKQVR